MHRPVTEGGMRITSSLLTSRVCFLPGGPDVVIEGRTYKQRGLWLVPLSCFSFVQPEQQQFNSCVCSVVFQLLPFVI